jgi:hypothetical protein
MNTLPSVIAKLLFRNLFREVLTYHYISPDDDFFALITDNTFLDQVETSVTKNIISNDRRCHTSLAILVQTLTKLIFNEVWLIS